MSDCDSCIYLHECSPTHKDDSTDCDGYTQISPLDTGFPAANLADIYGLRIAAHSEMMRVANLVPAMCIDYLEHQDGETRRELIEVCCTLVGLLHKDEAWKQTIGHKE